MTKKIPDTFSSIDPQTVLAQLSMELLREQKRRARRRKLWGAGVILALIFTTYQVVEAYFESDSDVVAPHVGLIDVKGAIFENESDSAENFMKSMNKAYSSKGMKALILRIDSPGGSPVQADYMYNTIQFYKKSRKDMKIYAVCVDMCASAAYYVAAAADEIYANPSSIVGSIGVIYNGFGFVDLMQKAGVTRRLETAGRNKGFMDPFSPMDPVQEKMLQNMLSIIHNQFIEKVKAGRGSRLKVDEDTFSGLFWTGLQAKERGLIDGFASSGQVAREIVKLDRIVDYSYKEASWEKFARHIGIAMVDKLPEALGMKIGFR